MDHDLHYDKLFNFNFVCKVQWFLHYLIMQIQVVSKTGWINRLVCLLLCLQLFLLKMHAHPSGYLFDQKSMRLHLHTCVSNEAMHGFHFLLRDAEEKKEVMS